MGEGGNRHKNKRNVSNGFAQIGSHHIDSYGGVPGSPCHGDFMGFKDLAEISGETCILIHMYAEAAVGQIRRRRMSPVSSS